MARAFLLVGSRIRTTAYHFSDAILGDGPFGDVSTKIKHWRVRKTWPEAPDLLEQGGRARKFADLLLEVFGVLGIN